MGEYFCVSVSLLDVQFNGMGDERAEWPPSPYRLFQALLNAANTGRYQTDWNRDWTEAFQWLEKLTQYEPPRIITPRHQVGVSYTLNPPNNDSDKELQRQNRLTTKRFQPILLPENASVHFAWTLPAESRDAASKHIELLSKAASRLHTFGRGIDAACATARTMSGDQVERLAGCQWIAKAGPVTNVRRIPTRGTLRDLQQCHTEFSERIQGKTYIPPTRPSVFDVVRYEDDEFVPPRPYAVYELRQLKDTRRTINFRPKFANHVAAMLRSAACRAAKDDAGHEFPGGTEAYVAGHEAAGDLQQRFSYLVLPTIGHPNADGLIRRVMIAEQQDGDGSHVAWLANRLRGRCLIEESTDKAVAMLQLVESDGVIERYCGEARVWQSVTPVILPGFDDVRAIDSDRTSPTKAERLFVKSLHRTGIPIAAIESLSLRKAPSWPGALHPSHYRRPDYLRDHRSRPGWHVTLIFRRPAKGPFAIGAGRHCGFGILARVAAAMS